MSRAAKGAACKSLTYAFVGSSPTRSTTHSRKTAFFAGWTENMPQFNGMRRFRVN
jgi:hypothetical protein